MELRRRANRGEDVDKESPAESKKWDSKRLRKAVKQLDFYDKVRPEIMVETNATKNELFTYLAGAVEEHLVVDPTLGERMAIHFDVSFHALRCKDVNMDAMDVAGDQSDGIEQSILKQRLSKTGLPVGGPFHYYLPRRDSPGTGKKSDAAHMSGHAGTLQLADGPCGSCYGAETADRPCCNSCHEVKAAYLDAGWAVEELDKNAAQCVEEAAAHVDTDGKEGEGCRVWGMLRVNKVPGTFHAAMGETHVRGYRHIHQFNPNDVPKYNVTHTVHHLSFFGTAGQTVWDIRGPADAPLDNTVHVNRNVNGMVHYFLKVIPVDRVYDSAGTHRTGSKLSVSKVFTPAEVNGHRQAILPGVYFVYELNPFMVQLRDSGETFAEFLSRVFGLAGGIIVAAQGLTKLLELLAGPDADHNSPFVAIASALSPVGGWSTKSRASRAGPLLAAESPDAAARREALAKLA